MTGTLAQLIAIVSYGNEFFKNGNLPDHFYPKHTSFNFCNSVDFVKFNTVSRTSNTEEFVVANDPKDWFSQLADRGVKFLRLFYQPSADQSRVKDHQMAGMIGGGGTWLIEAIYDDHSDFWQDRWEVTRKDDPESKIWSVKYGLVAPNETTRNTQHELPQLRENLSDTLSKISAFAFSKQLDNFGQIFSRALAVLNSENPEKEYFHHDLIVNANYSIAAKQLLYAAASAWVFGGMGSWNDMGFPDHASEKLYSELTQILYADILDSITATVNSF
ncbi:hypothetical protein ACJVDH_07110 [Pedobacter sp. AW1-32]|uniref:hypothetical protein n=1 Tax=Pedobacter sp. AW1-32 TaxID=3383026 RepID=UPI003FEE546A